MPTYAELQLRVQVLEKAIGDYVRTQKSKICPPCFKAEAWDILEELGEEIENRSEEDE